MRVPRIHLKNNVQIGRPEGHVPHTSQKLHRVYFALELEEMAAEQAQESGLF